MNLRYSNWITLLLFSLLTSISFAGNDPVHTLHKNESFMDINSGIKYFIDSLNEFSSKDLGTNDFNARFRNEFNASFYKNKEIWVRFFIKIQDADHSEFVLESRDIRSGKIYYKGQNESTFYSKKLARFISYPKNKTALLNTTLEHFKIQLKPYTTYEIIVHFPNPNNNKIKPGFSIYTVDNWLLVKLKSESITNLLTGLFFGVLFVLGLLNFIYFYIHKDRTYFIYSIYILSVVFYQSSILGLINYTVFSRYFVINSILVNISLLLSVIFYLLFLMAFVGVKQKFPSWTKSIYYLIVIQIISMVIYSILVIIDIELQNLAIFIRSLFLLIILPFIAFYIYEIYRKGNNIDQIIMIGSSVLLISGTIGLISNVFNFGLKSDLIFQIGIVIELIIFSIGLNLKSRFYEKEKRIVQLKLIDQLQENEKLQFSIKQHLEKQVHKRTSEIQIQNEELLQQQEELSAHRDTLEEQNHIIAQSMTELETIKSKLEITVKERTMQLKEANHELIQHNNQLEQYAFITAHNLRAPVARLKGLMYILEHTNGINKSNREVVNKIVKSAHEMDDVLSDMNAILELKYKIFGKAYKVDIKIVIGKVTKILNHNIHQSKAKIKLKLEIKHIIANEPYLESIIYNLVSNAIKYRSSERELNIVISSCRNGNTVLLKISDNGIGIDLSKYKEKLFGLYQRFHDHVAGKGLGLYLVKTQVEALGGTIQIDSKTQIGTTFIISLPNNS